MTECLKCEETKEAGYSGKDYNGVRDTALDEPKYSGGKQLCEKLEQEGLI